MYTPKHASTEVSSSSKQIRLLLMGIPGSGKTYSTVTTFPNPVVLNVDNNCDNKDIIALKPVMVPFYKPEVRKAISPGTDKKDRTNMADALTTWIHTEAVQLTSEQTLIIDSLSTIADGVSTDMWKITPSGKSGAPDVFWFYDKWAEWWCGLCTILKDLLVCNLVVIMHEKELRDKETGRVLKYDWILEGNKFSPRMGQFFTDVFRASVLTKESGGTDKPQVERVFRWQVMPDDKFPQCKTRINTKEKFVPATYKSFKEYTV